MKTRSIGFILLIINALAFSDADASWVPFKKDIIKCGEDAVKDATTKAISELNSAKFKLANNFNEISNKSLEDLNVSRTRVNEKFAKYTKEIDKQKNEITLSLQQTSERFNKDLNMSKEKVDEKLAQYTKDVKNELEEVRRLKVHLEDQSKDFTKKLELMRQKISETELNNLRLLDQQSELAQRLKEAQRLADENYKGFKSLYEHD